jgi:hypothetical protein
MSEFFYFITIFLATFIMCVTHYNKTIEREQPLNQTWQKIVEFKLNYFYTK